MLAYEEAVRIWALKNMSRYKIRKEIVEDSVSVNFVLDEGFGCCGGTDPDCYCSFAESPSCKAEISFLTVKGKKEKLELGYLDFADTVREIYDIGSE